MAFKYVFVALIAVAITLFALQNSGATSVRFLFWSLDAIPLAGVILLSVASGMVLVGVPLWIDRWRLRKRARALETRVERVEATLAERERRPQSPAP
jgi:uncharacterized integral membrane protein